MGFTMFEQVLFQCPFVHDMVCDMGPQSKCRNEQKGKLVIGLHAGFIALKLFRSVPMDWKRTLFFFLKMGYSNWNGTEHNFPHQIPIYKLTLLISDTLKPDYYIGLRYDCIPIMGLYIPHFYWLDQKHIYSTILLKTVIYTSIYLFLHLHHGCCYTPRVDEIMNISNEAKVPLVAGRKRSIHCIWLPN